MNLRKKAKRWLYGSCPGFRGVLPYWGERLHFPPHSVLFERACEEGIYEFENQRLLASMLSPGMWYFDIGANLGLMSAPLLHCEPTLQVVSVEPSPRIASYLARTIQASPCRDRWHLVQEAVGAVEGEVEFNVSGEGDGCYDGTKDTGRGPGSSRVKVQLTTLDALWKRFGSPGKCLVKIDVEGGESEVLRGGLACLAATRPFVLVEWNRTNLAAHGRDPDGLPGLARGLDYEVLSVPALLPVSSLPLLRLHMNRGEYFVLAPRT